jgi:hypothetical protein
MDSAGTQGPPESCLLHATSSTSRFLKPRRKLPLLPGDGLREDEGTRAAKILLDRTLAAL